MGILLEDLRSFNAIVAAIASTRNWQTMPMLASTVVTTETHGQAMASAIKVNRNAETWSLTGNENATGMSFDPVRGLVMRYPEGEEHIGLERRDLMPLQVSLFHPWQMRIWGGEHDQMKITDASEKPESVTLHLELREAGTPGIAVMNREFGVFTEYRDATVHVVLKDLHIDFS